MRDKQPTIRQILVVTDGCSNIGEDPVDCAGRAKLQGITVNVIGIVDKGVAGKQGYSEAMSIADAGGGLCRIVQPTELSATVQMLTHQTMQLTLQQVVQQELANVLGKPAEAMAPQERSKVMQVVDKLEEEVYLELVVAVDTSASMKDKIPLVREAIRDLALSLQARKGQSRVAVVVFPGSADEAVRTIQPFQENVDMDQLEAMFVARGGTPTGPAIDCAVTMFNSVQRDDVYPEHRWTGDAAIR